MTSPATYARRLLESAALLIDEEGPDARHGPPPRHGGRHLHDGGLHALRRDAGAGQRDRGRGLCRLFAQVEAVEATDDPLADLRRIAVAYRENALDNPHLYSVMFGSASLGGYRLHDDELEVGLGAFGQLVEATKAAMRRAPSARPTRARWPGSCGGPCTAT